MQWRILVVAVGQTEAALGKYSDGPLLVLDQIN
jgi:hypothetical protein